MYLLDTDIVSHLHAGHPQVVANFRAAGDPEIGTTVVTKIEILRARFDFILKATTGEQLLRAHQWLNISEEQLSNILIAPFDQAAANQFERLRGIRKLRKIGRADLLIASITLANNATLVSRNVRHFRQVPNLRVVNWVDL
jgi:tRNA(fMet)-specific endonuclease VapC